MESSFTHKKCTYNCDFEIDSSDDPCFIFVTLNDKTLIKNYGTELTIKTDFERVLPYDDGFPKMDDLRQDIFDGIKTKPEVGFAKLKMVTYTKNNNR